MICYKANHLALSSQALVTTCGQTSAPATPIKEVTALSPVLVQTLVEITNLQSYQQSLLHDASSPVYNKTSQACEELLFKLFKLSLLILTTGTADRVVVGGGAVFCPTAFVVNTCGSEDGRRVKMKVDVLLDDQRGASLTISQGALAACVGLDLQAVMEGNDCKNNELKCRKAWNCLGFLTDQLRHTTFPRAARGGCGRT